MIQLGGFTSAKEQARLPFGRASGVQYNYEADLQKRWDTALDARFALDVIGGMSVAPGHVEDVQAWLGPLTDEERLFAARYAAFYRKVAALTTTVPVAVNTDPDVYETILDTRILRQHIAAPGRVLDIGPGAGRHLANLVLRPWGGQAAYVGVESVGLPYVLQNLVGAALSLENPGWEFRDQLEHEMARAELSVEAMLAPRHATHLPLWRADLLPSGGFDLIICNYVLDEISAHDFDRVMALVSRCLAPGGIVYCRGSQQRSMLKALYHFGFGTFHQRDITAAFREHGLRATWCELIASTLTRVLVRADAPLAVEGYAAYESDVPLVEKMQHDFVAAAIATVKARALPLLIWADPGYLGPTGYDAVSRLLLPNLGELNVVGITNEQISVDGPGLFGVRNVPLAKLHGLGVRAVFIAGYRISLATRELRQSLAPSVLGPNKQFSLPFSWALVEPPA